MGIDHWFRRIPIDTSPFLDEDNTKNVADQQATLLVGAHPSYSTFEAPLLAGVFGARSRGEKL